VSSQSGPVPVPLYPDSKAGEQLRKLLGTVRADLENFDLAAKRALRNPTG